MLTPFISWGMFSREGWVPEVLISFFSFFRFFARVCGVAVVCVPCFLVGGGWVRMGFGSCSCSVWCVRGARRWPGTVFLWSRGGAKTRGFRRGEKTKQRTKEKRKKRRKNLKVLGPGGANVRENTAKTRCFESEKTKAPKTKKKTKKNSQELPPPTRG